MTQFPAEPVEPADDLEIEQDEETRQCEDVPASLAGERIDVALARLFGVSRSKAAELIEQGRVDLTPTGTDRALHRPGKSHRLEVGDQLCVVLPEERDPLEVRAEIVEGVLVIYDDPAIVVVDKPVGVAVHPSMGWTGPTLVGHLQALGYRIATGGAPERQGIVQRLDVGTSGAMVIAKSERAYSVLKQAFRDRAVDKTYHALVQGHPDPWEGTIDAPIGRHTSSDWRFAVRADGKPSITHYRTLEAHRFASLMEIHLETGRTHQIRVHMSACKHPCVGDVTYGADPTLAKRLGLQRQWLHATKLGFVHPESREYVDFSSPYPADLEQSLAKIRTSA